MAEDVNISQEELDTVLAKRRQDDSHVVYQDEVDDVLGKKHSWLFKERERVHRIVHEKIKHLLVRLAAKEHPPMDGITISQEELDKVFKK